MDDFFARSAALLGEKTMESLRTTRVILFGVGGVGSYAAEALIRTGLTHLTLVDGDTVQPSNLNRQLPATRATLGMPKVEALKERLLTINPDAEIEAIAKFYHDDDENLKSKILHHQYLIDAIDSVDDKVHLILYASRVRGMKVFSSMGAALRFDPTKVTTGELMTIQGDGTYSGQEYQLIGYVLRSNLSANTYGRVNNANFAAIGIFNKDEKGIQYWDFDINDVYDHSAYGYYGFRIAYTTGGYSGQKANLYTWPGMYFEKK